MYMQLVTSGDSTLDAAKVSLESRAQCSFIAGRTIYLSQLCTYGVLPCISVANLYNLHCVPEQSCRALTNDVPNPKWWSYLEIYLLCRITNFKSRTVTYRLERLVSSYCRHSETSELGGRTSPSHKRCWAPIGTIITCNVNAMIWYTARESSRKFRKF